MKSFWRRDKSQLCAARKSAPIIKLGLSLLALTTTVDLYSPSPMPTRTSVCPKVGTGLPPTPSSRGVSCVSRRNWLTCCTLLYKGRPIIDTEAPVSISASVFIPSTVIGINQQPGWLSVSTLISLGKSESDVKVQGCRWGYLVRSLDRDCERTLKGGS